MIRTNRPPVSLEQAQRIAESIVGQVSWFDAEAYCVCPGVDLHTKANASKDCVVFCQNTDKGAVGIYCFHTSCSALVAEASYRLRSELGKATPSSTITTSPLPPRRIAPKPKPTFDPSLVEHTTSTLLVDHDFFRNRSPIHTKITAETYLKKLFNYQDNVLIFNHLNSQGQHLWTHQGPASPPNELATFRHDQKEGVWFLSNPISGEYHPTSSIGTAEPKLSRRTGECITDYRFLVLESDVVPPHQWLSLLAQIPLPISSIVTSGGRSVHALIEVNADDKAEWEDLVGQCRPKLISLGADPKAMRPVQLTRLPSCDRGPSRQTLLYLNPLTDHSPISSKTCLRVL